MVRIQPRKYSVVVFTGTEVLPQFSKILATYYVETFRLKPRSKKLQNHQCALRPTVLECATANVSITFVMDQTMRVSGATSQSDCD